MKTISVDTARKLKAAGLLWEPKENDLAIALDNEERELAFVSLPPNVIYVDKKRNIWLPTFDDLLEWLEGRGHFMHITNLLVDAGNPGAKCWEVLLFDAKRSFRHNTLIEAAAQAVLWALKQEGERFAK